MGVFYYLTAGESHGKGLMAIVHGLPAGLALTADDINEDLARRQKGFGRGQRMQIERDTVEFLSGVRFGKTLGSPVAMMITNKDWKNWQHVMAAEPMTKGAVGRMTRPRPGHADLPGVLKYAQDDVRNILERASARETAIRCAVGACAKKLLNEFSIKIASHVLRI